MSVFNLLPKKTLILIAVLAVIFITLLIVLFLPKNPTPSKNDTSIVPTSSTVKITHTPQRIPVFRSGFETREKPEYRIVFNLPQGLTLPKTIEMLEVSREITDSDTVFLKNRFNIEGDPFISGTTRYWQSDDQKRALQIDVESGYIQYGNDETTPEERITSQQAKGVAEEFLEKFNLLTIYPNAARVLMLTGDGELSETQNEAAATMFEIYYVLSHDGAPIYYQFATPATVSVLVDSNGKVRGLRYFNIRPIQTTQNTLIDLEEVRARVLSGDYTIVKTDGNQDTIPQSGNITITNASVIHFDDKKNTSLYPTILLEGTLQPSGRNISLYVSVLNN